MRPRTVSILLVLALSGSTVALSGCMGGASATTFGPTPPSPGDFATYEVVRDDAAAQYVLIQFRGPADVVGPDFTPQAAWIFDTWTDDTPIDAPPDDAPDEIVVMGVDGFQLYVGWPCAKGGDACVSVVSARQAGQPAMGIIGIPWFVAVTPGDTWRIPWRSPWVGNDTAQTAMFAEVGTGTDDEGNQTLELRAWDVDASGQPQSVDHTARYATEEGYPLSLRVGGTGDADEPAVVWTRVTTGHLAPALPPVEPPLLAPTPAAKADWEGVMPPGLTGAGDAHGFTAEDIWSELQNDPTARDYLKQHPAARLVEMDVVYGPPPDGATGESESHATVLVWDGEADKALEATVVQERASFLGIETRNRTTVEDVGTKPVDAWHHQAPATRPVVEYDDLEARVCALAGSCTQPISLWLSNGVFPDVEATAPHLRYRFEFAVSEASGTFSVTASADSGTLVDAEVPIEDAQAFLGPMPWA